MNKKQMEKYLKDAIQYIFHHKSLAKKKISLKKKKTARKLTFAQECGIPEPDHEYGYTDAHIKSFLTKKEYVQFVKWMYGQTCAWDEKRKECIAYGHDVMRFVDMVRKGTPTYWD